jgi:hypothetical protein
MFINHFLLIFGRKFDSNIDNIKFIEEAENNEEGFGVFYDQNIRPEVIVFEKIRIKALKKLRLYSFLAVLATILIIPLSLIIEAINNLGENQGAFLGLAVVAVAFIWYLATSPSRKFKESIKSQIFHKIFTFFGNINYKPQGSDSISKYEKFNILPSYDQYENEDLVFGTFKGVEFSIEEILLQNITRDRKGRRRVTNIFDGIAILLKMNKNFQGQTLIKRDLGFIRNFFKAKFSKLENVKLEDPEFEKIFEVYSSDQVEARYLLTTSFMQRLLDLGKIFSKIGSSKQKNINAGFLHNSLLITLRTKQNLFEPSSIFQPATFITDCKILIREINVIFSIIEELRLNQKIGL